MAWLLLLAVVLPYGNIVRNGFVAWDDDINVFHNPYLNPVTPRHVLDFWIHTSIGKYPTYRPVVYTVYAAIAGCARLPAPGKVLGGGETQLDPRPFHLVSVLLHASNVLLLFIILKLLFENEMAAAAGALVFGLHPIQVEVVAWITGMSDLLAAFFGLLALWQYLLYAGTDADETDSRRRRKSYLLALGCFALALLAKPSTVALPVVVFIIDVLLLGRSNRQAARALAPWFGLAVCGVLVTRLAEPIPLQRLMLPWWQRPFIAGDALTFYLVKFAAPFHLASDYGRDPRVVLGHWWGYCGWCLPITLAALLWWRGRKQPAVMAAAAIALAASLPNMGFLPFRYQAFSTVADRYVYMAMIGPALGLAWWLARTRSRATWVACALVLAAWTGLAARQTFYWHDSITLFRHSLAVNPEAGLMHYNLGTSLLREHKVDEAMGHYREAIRLQPDIPDPHYNLGVLMARQGNVDEARRQFLTTLALRPGDALSNYNLGLLDAAQGQNEQAVELYRAALQSEPDNAEIHNDLGTALARTLRMPEALAEFQTAVTLDPSLANGHYNFGSALAISGRLPEAIAEYQTVLRLDPKFPGARDSLDHAQRDAERAIGPGR